MTSKEIKNPLTDSVHNENWADLKQAFEKSVADKINAKVQDRKAEIMDKIIGR